LLADDPMKAFKQTEYGPGNREASVIKQRNTQEKAHKAMFIRIICIKRTETKIMLVKFAYNMKRLILHERRAAAGKVYLEQEIRVKSSGN
jgi:hypothetical protein